MKLEWFWASMFKCLKQFFIFCLEASSLGCRGVPLRDSMFLQLRFFFIYTLRACYCSLPTESRHIRSSSRASSCAKWGGGLNLIRWLALSSLATALFLRVPGVGGCCRGGEWKVGKSVKSAEWPSSVLTLCPLGRKGFVLVGMCMSWMIIKL